jgi:hypothetical protein
MFYNVLTHHNLYTEQLYYLLQCNRAMQSGNDVQIFLFFKNSTLNFLLKMRPLLFLYFFSKMFNFTIKKYWRHFCNNSTIKILRYKVCISTIFSQARVWEDDLSVWNFFNFYYIKKVFNQNDKVLQINKAFFIVQKRELHNCYIIYRVTNNKFYWLIFFFFLFLSCK